MIMVVRKGGSMGQDDGRTEVSETIFFTSFMHTKIPRMIEID
jgi:hypothetical protein